MLDEVLCNQLVDQIEVSLIDDLVIEAACQRLVVFDGHAVNPSLPLAANLTERDEESALTRWVQL